MLFPTGEVVRDELEELVGDPDGVQGEVKTDPQFPEAPRILAHHVLENSESF